MKWRTSHLNEEDFRRLTGVKRETFAAMLKILREAHKRKKVNGGRPNKLSVRKMLLMSMEYLREYRTYFHVSLNYGLSESAAYETIRWVEQTLISDGTFSLPGKKALLNGDSGIEIILVDATESPLQRPKKNSGGITPAKRNATH